jgi:tetratricopeptide (TPR) repeat protein
MNPEEFLSQGMEQFSTGNYNAAIESFTKAIELDTSLVDAYYKRGLAYFYKGDNLLAIEDFTEAIRLNPNYTEAYYERGRVRAEERKVYEQAIEDFSRAIDLNANFAEAYYERGRIHEKETRTKPKNVLAALEDYTQAIRLKPNFADAYYARAFTRIKQTETQGAIADLTKMIEINSSDFDALSVRAQLRFEQQEYIGAIEDYTQIINILEPIKVPEVEQVVAKVLLNRSKIRSLIEDTIEAQADRLRACQINGELCMDIGDTIDGTIGVSPLATYRAACKSQSADLFKTAARLYRNIPDHFQANRVQNRECPP